MGGELRERGDRLQHCMELSLRYRDYHAAINRQTQPHPQQHGHKFQEHIGCDHRVRGCKDQLKVLMH